MAQTHEAFKLIGDVNMLKEISDGGSTKEAMFGSRTFEHAIQIVGEQNRNKLKQPAKDNKHEKNKETLSNKNRKTISQ